MPCPHTLDGITAFGLAVERSPLSKRLEQPVSLFGAYLPVGHHTKDHPGVVIGFACFAIGRTRRCGPTGLCGAPGFRLSRFSGGAFDTPPLSLHEPIYVALNALSYPPAQISNVFFYAQRPGNLLAEMAKTRLQGADHLLDTLPDLLSGKRQSKVAVGQPGVLPEHDIPIGFDLYRRLAIPDRGRKTPSSCARPLRSSPLATTSPLFVTSLMLADEFLFNEIVALP